MAEEITLGTYLTRDRESRGLSVDDVASGTRIVPRLIRALETDRLLDLSAAVSARGVVRAYGDVVGVDPAHALRRLAVLVEPAETSTALDPSPAATTDSVATPSGGRGIRQPEPTRTPPGRSAPRVTRVSVARPTLVTTRRHGRRRLAAVAGLVFLAALVFYPVGVNWAERHRRGDHAPAAPTLVGAPSPPTRQAAAREAAAGPSVGAGATGSPGSPGATAAGGRPRSGSGAPVEAVVPSPPGRGTGTSAGPPSGLGAGSAAVEPAGGRTLVMRARDTTWVRVTAGDEPSTVETLSPGAGREWRSAGRFRVTLGNAGGVRLELEGQSLHAALGALGEVVRDVRIPGEPGS